MNTIRLAIYCGSAVVALGACGGGGSSGEDLPTDQELSDRIVQLYEEVEASSIVAPVDLPGVDTGNVTYEGVFELDPANFRLPEVRGEFTLSVGFDDGQINGTATNLISDKNERYSGSLNLVGSLDRNAADSIDASVDGTITNAAGQVTTISATADGAFFGDNAQYAHGDLEGTISGGDYPDGGTELGGSYYTKQ